MKILEKTSFRAVAIVLAAVMVITLCVGYFLLSDRACSGKTQ